MAGELIVESKLKIRDGKVRLEIGQLPGYLDPLVVFAEGRVQHGAQESVRSSVARIRLQPRLTGLESLFQVSGYVQFISSHDVKLLLVTGAAAQLKCFPVVLRGEVKLA